MKNNILFGCLVLLPVLAVLAGCDKTSRLPEKPELVSPVSELLFPMSGGKQTVSFETNRAWTAMVDTTKISTDVSWCTISAASGASGANTVTVTVEGMEGDYREAKLILNASAAGKVIRIMQSGVPLVTTDAPSEITEAGALLSMTWQYAGEISVSEVGFALKESSAADFSDLSMLIEEAGVPGTYTLAAGSLKSSTEYAVKAFLETADGARYEGEELTFTTAEAPRTVPISEIKALGREVAAGGASTVTENLIIEATVIASYVEPVPEPEPEPETKSVSVEETKIVVVDGAGKDSGITLNLEAGTNVYEKGDRVSVRVKDAVLSHMVNGAVYLKPLPSMIEKLSSGETVAPVTVSHTELADYESMYVMIENTQLLSSYSDMDSWSSSDRLSFEVDGSGESYDAFVPAASEIAADAPSLGSGSISGIVVSDDESSYLLMLSSRDDVAGLDGERFESLLTLSFMEPEFSGVMYVGEKISNAVIRIEFRNGDGSVLDNVSATVSGPASEGISVASVSDVTLTGSGYVDLVVEGTPAVEGEVTFTVTGIDGLDNPSCTAVVEQPYVPVIGNFNVSWDFNGIDKGVREVPLAGGSSASGIEISSMSYVGTGEKNNWKDSWGFDGWDTNSANSPSKYFTFSIVVPQGRSLDLTGMDLIYRINPKSSTVDLYVQYSVNGAPFKDAYKVLKSAETDHPAIPLGIISDLTGIAEGSTIDFRIFAISTDDSLVWGLSKTLSLYGNAD